MTSSRHALFIIIIIIMYPTRCRRSPRLSTDLGSWSSGSVLRILFFTAAVLNHAAPLLSVYLCPSYRLFFFKSSGSPMLLFLYVQRAIFVSFFREDAIKRKCNSPHIPFPIYQSPNTSTGCHCSQIAKHNRLSADVTTTACVQYRSSKHRKKNWHGLPSLKWVPEKVKAAGVIVPTECPSLVCKIWLLAPYTFFFV